MNFANNHQCGRGNHVLKDGDVTVLVLNAVSMEYNASFPFSARVSLGQFRLLQGTDGKHPSEVDGAPFFEALCRTSSHSCTVSTI